MTNTFRTILLGTSLLACFRLATAQDAVQVEPPRKPVLVSAPVVPTITPAVRDLPDWKPEGDLFGLEMKRRDDFNVIPIEYPITPRVDPLLQLQQESRTPQQPENFSSL